MPVGSYLVSQYQNLNSKAAETKNNQPLTQVTPPNDKKLLDDSASKLDASLQELLNSPATDSSSPTIASSFGPTLSLKILLEGRSLNNQKTKLFVGILEGLAPSFNPKFLLTFMVDVPAGGSYGNLSLAGLSVGTNYTAILKGSAQIATSSAFVMSPTESKLNNGVAISLTAGDLNDDNIINVADYSIIQSSYGATASSPNWNENADLNKDGIINTFDTAYVLKNLGKVGDSGVWTSTTSQASSSASLSPDASSLPVGSVNGSNSGYWIWVPSLSR